MEPESDSIEIKCEIPVLRRLFQRHALTKTTDFQSSKSKVIINCRHGAKKICDRWIIGAASDVLEEILVKVNGDSDEVALDISEEILSTLLACFIGSGVIDPSQVIPLYAAARRFAIHELSKAIEECFSPSVFERFLRAQSILDKVCGSDLPHIFDLIKGLDISVSDGALLVQALVEWKSQDAQADSVFLRSIRGILAAAIKSNDPWAPPTDCYLGTDDGELQCVTGVPSDSFLGLSDDPRRFDDDIDDNFVVKGNLCISIDKGDLKVSPLEEIPGKPRQTIIIRTDDLLGIDCSASHIIVWSEQCIYSVTIGDGQPTIKLLKSFEFKIAKVFAFERDSSSAIAVVESGTDKIYFYDSQIKEYRSLLDYGIPSAVSNDYVLTFSENLAKVYDISTPGGCFLKFSIELEAATEADFVIRGPTIFALSAVAKGLRLSKFRNGHIVKETLMEGIRKRFVRVLQ